MRKSVPDYYKLMEDSTVKFVSIEELARFSEKESKGNQSPLKFPKEAVYYRRCAMDNVVMTSLLYIQRLVPFIGLTTIMYAAMIGGTEELFHRLFVSTIDFMLAAMLSRLVYAVLVGNKYFVVIDNDEEMIENLKHKSPLERSRIFRTYPECKEIFTQKMVKESKDD